MSDHTTSRALYKGSHGTATVVHRALPFVTGTDSACFVCVHEWAVIPVGLESRNEHIHNLEKGAISWMLRRGRTMIRSNSQFLHN